jgi:hypothetical protein
MSPEIIALEKNKDTHIKEVMKKSEKLSERIIERYTLITYDNNIYIPQSLRKRIWWWYHTYLQHPGVTRMEATQIQNLAWPNLKYDAKTAENNCHECQIDKKVRKKYGDLPEKLAERPVAWNRVDVDLIGPLTINTPKKEISVSINNDRTLDRLV